MPDTAAPDTAGRKTCFVIIGYGRKTDPATGRTLDLDKTFEQLIQPACDAAGLNGFRAIDANLTGSIDRLMHEWICLADVVIADLTTLNANVFYELGVRHSLRPSTTVLLADRKLMDRIPFDLSSFIVHAYDHPDDGGAGTAGGAIAPAAVEQLSGLLQRLLHEGTRGEMESDSPVYDFLRGLKPPPPPEALASTRAPVWVSPDQRAVKRRDERTLADVIGLAKAHFGEHAYDEAERLFRKAIDLFRGEKPGPGTRIELSLYQGLAEATWRNGDAPGPGGEVDRARAMQSLRAAEQILKDDCALDITADAETLRIAGDVYRRLFGWHRRLDRHRPQWLRHLVRKFYFSFDDRQSFESALDCYERAWTSTELREHAESTADVLRDVARSTWNPVLKLRYYSEASTARRRARREGPQPGLLRTAALLLLLLLGAGASFGYALAGVPFSLQVENRWPEPPPRYTQPGPATIVTVPDDRLDDLRTMLTDIHTAVGIKSEGDRTILATAGDTYSTVLQMDPRFTEILTLLKTLGPVDMLRVLEILRRIDTSVGDAEAPGGPAAASILGLVRQIDRRTDATSIAASDIRRTVGTSAPSGESVLDIVERIDGTTEQTSRTTGNLGKQAQPVPSDGSVHDIAGTATTILQELRRLRVPPVDPTTLSRTGPSMQFGNLPNAVRGFAYSLSQPGAVVNANELGLTIDVAGPADAEPEVVRLSVRVQAASAQARVWPGLVVARRARSIGWTDDDSTRGVQFEAEDFWYALVVNRDDRGRYVVVRRCNAKCEPSVP